MPISGPKKRRRGQKALVYDEGRGLSTEARQYEGEAALAWFAQVLGS